MGAWSTYSLFKKMTLQNKDLHFLSQAEVEAVQKVLLTMMDDIDSVCSRNHLTYVMSGGCALGAVRHGGFIPWDDDVDLCMPRADYDRFRACMLAEKGDDYYVQEVRACKKYDLNFMKVRLKNSRFCEFLESEPEKAGLFIDIFPVENVSSNRIGRKIQWFFSDGMQFVCSCVRIRKKKDRLLSLAGDSKEAAAAIKKKARIGALFSLIPFRRWLLWTERILKHNRNAGSKYVAIPTGGKHFKGETYPREWLFPPKPIRFEDRTYMGMNNVKAYLRQMYGDYQVIPKEEERERHALLEFELPEDEMTKEEK